MDINQNKLRNPRIIKYSMPEETTIANIGATIMAQNPAIVIDDETIEAKFRFKDKRGRYNIVMELGPQTSKQILQAKLKIGWNICRQQITLSQHDATNVVNLITNTMNAKVRIPAHIAPANTR